MKKILAAACTLALLLPLISHAHPGHGDTDGYTIIHYFREPVHAIISLSIVLAVALTARYADKRRARK
ncbi:MAG: hypothetical protein KGO82_10315 [Bacteroidota bacterium]|nr:hypothetical protein [Bacteroidota bacterium]